MDLNSQEFWREGGKGREGGRRLTLPNLLYKATVIKIVCYLHKDRPINQWNQTMISKQTHI